MSVNSHDELVDNGYTAISHLFKSGKFNIVTITPAVAILMRLMETYPTLTGVEKKRLVIAILQKAVEESGLSDEEKVVTLMVVDQVVPDVIDLVVSAAKGNLGLNIKESCNAFSCFGKKK